MRDYKIETKKRVAWIKKILNDSGAQGIVFGNSGGKDSALVGILAKMATDNVLGIIMPCTSKQNYGSDMEDGKKLSTAFNIHCATVDLTEAKNAIISSISSHSNLEKISDDASKNINPRLRMATLYAVGQTMGYLVAGTGNKCEYFTGYFTKWGDGACDFNPIRDLTVSEIYEFLAFLKAPEEIISKVPSAGLFEGQTDESEMGVTYDAIEQYMSTGETENGYKQKIQRLHNITAHKRAMPLAYDDELV